MFVFVCVMFTGLQKETQSKTDEKRKQNISEESWCDVMWGWFCILENEKIFLQHLLRVLTNSIATHRHRTQTNKHVKNPLCVDAQRKI